METLLKDSKFHKAKFESAQRGGRNGRHIREWISGPCKKGMLLVSAIGALTVGIVYLLDFKSNHSSFDQNNNNGGNRERRNSYKR